MRESPHGWLWSCRESRGKESRQVPEAESDSNESQRGNGDLSPATMRN